MYGHIYKLAQQVKEGIDSVEGMEGVLYQASQNTFRISAVVTHHQNQICTSI